MTSTKLEELALTSSPPRHALAGWAVSTLLLVACGDDAPGDSSDTTGDSTTTSGGSTSTGPSSSTSSSESDGSSTGSDASSSSSGADSSSDSGDTETGADCYPVVSEVGTCEIVWSAWGFEQAARVADRNDDSIPDVVAASVAGGTPSLAVLSGASGQVISTAEFPEPIDRIVDASGIGPDDVVVATRVSAGQDTTWSITRWNLATSQATWTHTFELAQDFSITSVLVSARDWNEDEARDLVVGHSSPFGTPGGIVVLSGATGDAIDSIASPPSASASFGSGLLEIPDVDSDALPDFIVGDAFGAPDCFDCGLFEAISSDDGQPAWTLVGEAGQLLGDGTPILLAPGHGGTPLAILGNDNYATVINDTVLANAGRILAVNPSTGELAWEFHSSLQAGNLGQIAAAVGDQNGDGTSDVLVAAPHMFPPVVGSGARLVVVDGANGNLLAQVREEIGPDEGSQHLGHHVAPLADLDGNGREEFIGEAPDASCDGTAGLLAAWSCTPAR